MCTRQIGDNLGLRWQKPVAQGSRAVTQNPQDIKPAVNTGGAATPAHNGAPQGGNSLVAILRRVPRGWIILSLALIAWVGFILIWYGLQFVARH